MKRYRSCCFFWLVIATLLSLIGCPRDVPRTDEELIRGVFDKFKAAYEEKDIDGLMGIFSEDYLSNGRTRVDVRATAETRFATYGTIVFTLTNLDIVIDGTTATATFHGLITGDGETLLNADWSDVLLKTGDVWLLYGNQLQ